MYLHNVRGINHLNGGSKLPNNINQTEQVNTTLIDKKNRSHLLNEPLRFRVRVSGRAVANVVSCVRVFGSLR